MRVKNRKVEHYMARLARKTGIIKNERIEIDFSILDKSFTFFLGRLNFTKAHHPLPDHIHQDRMEIVYLAKGKQTYIVEDRMYELNGGDIFITFPDEVHSSGENPEEKFLLYYFQINLRENTENFMGYGKEEGKELYAALINIRNRVIKAPKKLDAFLDKLINVYYSSQRFKKILLRNMVTEFLIQVIEHENSNYSLESNTRFQPVLDYIHENIEDIISIGDLAALSNLSETRFKLYFKKEIGIPPGEYILRKKIDVAKKLLETTDSSITSIAHQLNFSTSQYFSTVFKRFCVFSPHEYRRRADNRI